MEEQGRDGQSFGPRTKSETASSREDMDGHSDPGGETSRRIGPGGSPEQTSKEKSRLTRRWILA